MDSASQSQSPPTPIVPQTAPATPINTQSTATIVTVIVIISLLVFPLIGVILMWALTKWKLWVKITITAVLLVIPIILILIAILLISINPARQFAQANDTSRRSDVNATLNAVDQYATQNQGSLPGNLTSGQTYAISNTGAPRETGAAFCTALVPTIMASLPYDPKTGNFKSCNDYDTKYTIKIGVKSATGLPVITISAPDAQGTEPISVTR